MNDLSTLTRRRFLAVTGAVGGAAALAACGGKSTPPAVGNAAATSGSGGTAYDGPKVTVNFWNGWTGADGDVAKKMVADFNSKTSNVTVQMNIMQWADFFQKLPAAVTSGNGPDIAVMHIDDIPTQAAQSVIVPITDVANALGLQESDFAPAVWNGGMYSGKRYGIPIDVHDLGLYYNKTVMEKAGLDPDKPPTTGEEYLAACEKLKAAGIQGSWVSPFQFTGGFMFQSLLWQFGGDLYDKDVTKATWDSDAGVQALTWILDLIKKGYSPGNVAQDADYVALKGGKNAFNWQGIWQVNEATKLPDQKIATAPLPKVGSQGGVWGNSHQFVLPRTTSTDQNKAAAARYFVHWFTQNEIAWADSAKVPASNALAASAEFKKLTQLDAFAQEVPDVHFPPSVAGIGDATGKLFDAYQAAVLGKQSPADALKSSAAQATKILADNKKKYG
ncbi:MAG TPA: ABC transporter substrate-binding protein [Nakamurella sp.]|jgi:multiple sugar transport system substrate-binding protein|nr:ABC transporter substrate-binding protein [Nakamurella sp.]